MDVKCFSIICCFVTTLAYSQNIWIETSHEDFKDGIFERNIYVSCRDGGTIEFAVRFDLNNDSYLDLLSTDAHGPYVHLYWGSADGYNPGNVRLFPVPGSGNCDIADLDFDGYAELIVGLVGIDNSSNVVIYWGREDGPTASDYTFLPTYNQFTEACFASDLDNNGYLDIVASAYVDTSACIFWGNSTGYDPLNCTFLPVIFAQHNIEVADLNKDQYLDIIFSNNYGSSAYIYWGSPSGFSPGNNTILPFLYDEPHGLSVADLNNDSYLDIILTGYLTIDQSYIYWGSEMGFSPSNYQILNPGNSYGGSSVIDLNRDGFLDIIYFRGKQSARPIVYWGSSTGFSDLHSSEIGYVDLTGSGGFVADFDNNGDYDIFVNSVYTENSYIFWGPGYVTTTQLPANSDRHGLFKEIGNVYNREYYEDYISSIFDAGAQTNWGIVEWLDSLPAGTDILFYVRSGNTPNIDASWSGWDSLGKGDDIADSLDSRYLQYRARMTYKNPAYFPCLYEVRISYGGVAQIIIEPDQTGLTYPGIEKLYNLDVINLGVVIDTIDITYKHNQSWPVVLYDSTGTDTLVDSNNNGVVDVIIPPHDTFDIILSITPPITAVAGDIDTLILVGVSTIDPLVSDSALLITTIESAGTIVIYPDQSNSGLPDSWINFPLICRNNQSFVDTVDLTVQDKLGWTYSLLDSLGSPLGDHNNNGLVDIPGIMPFGGAVDFIARFYVPPGIAAGTVDSILLFGHSTKDSTVKDSVSLILTVGGGFVWGIDLDPDHETIVQPGGRVNLPVDVLLQGNISDVVDITVDFSQIGWVISLVDNNDIPLIDTDNDGTVDIGLVTPQQNSQFFVKITAPQLPNPGDEVDSLVVCDFYVRGTASYQDNITDSVHIMVHLMIPFDVHNFGNPFRTQTQFTFSLPKEGNVNLEIYNRAGEMVRHLIDNRTYSFGVHYYPWDGTNDAGKHLVPGVYIYILDFEATDGEEHTAKKKLVILK